MAELVKHISYDNRSLVVGFNLPYDLSRLAHGATPAKSRRYTGGFSLKIWPSPYKPSISIKNIDPKRAFIGFTGGKDPQGKRSTFRGHFVDVRTLIFALTSQSLSLKKACDTFEIVQRKQATESHGVITADYVTYNRYDVKATAELASKLLNLFDAHPISWESPRSDRCDNPISEMQAYSPASIAKAYLNNMGVQIPTLSPEHQGYAMAGYYGGRTEVKVRRVEVPVSYVDFRSMYPTVNTLMNLWCHITANRISVVDVTAQVRRFLEEASLETCFHREVWESMTTMVLLRPDGDILPVRGKYSPRGSWKIGINPYTSNTAQWYALPDVLAAKLLTGKAPQIIKALHYKPVGKQRSLHPVNFAGTVPIDPAKDNFFAKVVEERVKVKKSMFPYANLNDDQRDFLQQSLKILANAGSYGIFAEINAAKDTEIHRTVYGNDGPFERDTAKLEEPGKFFLGYIATCITAGARLMLALLEACVTEKGGVHVFTDTDSMAIVSTQTGGTLTIPDEQHGQCHPKEVIALSWHEVDEITNRFEALNPFNPDIVPGSILELKEHNYDDRTKERIELYAYAISPKRYVMYGKDREPLTEIQSSLGYLIDPCHDEEAKSNWIIDFWRVVAKGNTFCQSVTSGRAGGLIM